MPRTRVLMLFTSLAAGLMLLAQAPSLEQLQERFRQFSRNLEKTGLAEPFRGIAAGGAVEPGLFAVKSTGVSTEPVRRAAAAFLASLDEETRGKTRFAVDDVEWRKWANQHPYVRQGAGFDKMTAVQREAAFALLRVSLSAKGLKLTRDIMKLNHTLGELNNNNFVEYGEWLYCITVMGEPSEKEPWGWQLDGHHCVINYFVLGDQVVMTPSFFGSEPVIAKSGKYKGTVILQDEQDKGLALVNALPEALRRKAILESSKTKNYNVGEAFKDNVNLDYAGAPVRDFPEAQKRQLLDLVSLYVGNLREGHAKVKMDEVRKHLDRSWFVWIGGTEPGAVFYYRIHSPVVLIEFDHQLPVGLRHMAANPKLPDREHVHTVIRTPNGNDYGKDLLRQHYATHPH